MDKKYAINISKKFSKEVKNLFPIEKIVLFGSFARGTNHKWSDIDLAIVVNNYEYDYFKTYRKLGDVTFKLDARIEPIIIDKTKDYSGFLKTVYEEGIIVYSKKGSV